MQIPILNLEGKEEKKIELPEIFSGTLKPWLVRRAVISEQTYKLQPQGHFVLAGMQTTAAYYGAMSSYRTGRHMGKAIRPREKLGDGVQGKVRRIPSSVKGKRAHPHLIEKKIVELINKKEYQNAIKSALSGLFNEENIKHIIITKQAAEIKKSKEMKEFLIKLNLYSELENLVPRRRKGLRKLANQKKYKHVVLLVASDNSPILKAGKNIPGLDVSAVSNLKMNKLAPGGDLIQNVIFTEDAIEELPKIIEKFDVDKQALKE
jgi:large subunit ribosomal protein L4e